MSGGSTTALTEPSWAPRRLAHVLFAALALFMMVMAFGGEARACQPGAKIIGSASIAHRLKQAAPFAHVKGAMVSTHRAAKTHAPLGLCCGGSHAGSGCLGACCGGCVPAAVLAPGTGLPAPAAAVVSIFAADHQHAPVEPLRQFRPPRRTA